MSVYFQCTELNWAMMCWFFWARIQGKQLFMGPITVMGGKTVRLKNKSCSSSYASSSDISACEIIECSMFFIYKWGHCLILSPINSYVRTFPIRLQCCSVFSFAVDSPPPSFAICSSWKWSNVFSCLWVIVWWLWVIIKRFL